MNAIIYNCCDFRIRRLELYPWQDPIQTPKTGYKKCTIYRSKA